MIMPDDFFDELREELRAAYNPAPETPRERLWDAVRERRALRAAYNPPPATPRDRLWDGVQARRGTARPAAVVAGPASRPGAAARAARYRRFGWALPIAATLLVGIAIGRSFPAPSAPRVAAPTPAGEAASPAARGTAAPRSARATWNTSGAGGAEPREASADAAIPAPAGAVAGDPVARDGRPRGAVEDSPLAAALRDVAPGAAETGVAPAPAEVSPPARSARDGLYRVAALQTLGNAEALLAAVDEIGTSDGDAPRSLADWGEAMLSQTRLLMDSPAAGDPAIRELLEDLELVLAQLVRMGEGATAEGDIALIEGTMRERQLLHRIRALLPAGQITSGI